MAIQLLMVGSVVVVAGAVVLTAPIPGALAAVLIVGLAAGAAYVARSR